jgi:hypothetical protein
MDQYKMALIYSSEDIIGYYMLKGLFGGVSLPSGAMLYNAISTITVLPSYTIAFYSTITWVIPPNYSGIYSPGAYYSWLSGTGPVGDYKGIVFAGRVITTVVIYGNTYGTIVFYEDLYNPIEYSTIVFTWVGTINNTLILSYEDPNPRQFYGYFKYYFNLANTVTAVIYHTFLGEDLYTTNASIVVYPQVTMQYNTPLGPSEVAPIKTIVTYSISMFTTNTVNLTVVTPPGFYASISIMYNNVAVNYNSPNKSFYGIYASVGTIITPYMTIYVQTLITVSGP